VRPGSKRIVKQKQSEGHFPQRTEGGGKGGQGTTRGLGQGVGKAKLPNHHGWDNRFVQEGQTSNGENPPVVPPKGGWGNSPHFPKGGSTSKKGRKESSGPPRGVAGSCYLKPKTGLRSERPNSRKRARVSHELINKGRSEQKQIQEEKKDERACRKRVR